jgi:hypothetical protein
MQVPHISAKLVYRSNTLGPTSKPSAELPQAGSAIVLPGSGRTHSTIARISARGVKSRKDMLGQIFTKAQNKIQDPAKLYRLIDMINEVQWVSMGADVKGDIYEGLQEKNAEDTKSGAGQ